MVFRIKLYPGHVGHIHLSLRHVKIALVETVKVSIKGISSHEQSANNTLNYTCIEEITFLVFLFQLSNYISNGDFFFFLFLCINTKNHGKSLY